MIKQTGPQKIREMLDTMKAETTLSDLTGEWEKNYASIDDVISCNMSWSMKDIKHYLATETNNVRLARWCKLFLELDY
jgi:5'(3')-deoxyribonucleotidase